MRLICVLRAMFGMKPVHKWRKMRKGEKSYIPSEQQPFGPVSNYKVCRRCDAVVRINKRVKVTT